MATYVVQVKVINYGVIELEAEDENEAWEQAWDKLVDGEEGDLDWGHVNSEIESVEKAICPNCGRSLNLHEYVCEECGTRIYY